MDSPARARAGVSHALMERVGEGHCAFPTTDLFEKAEALLEIPRPILEEALSREVAEGFLLKQTIDGVDGVYPAGLYRHEAEVASLLKRLLGGRSPWGEIDGDQAIPWAEKRLSLELDPRQREALSTALKSKVVVITGGPGTGKTTLTRAL